MRKFAPGRPGLPVFHFQRSQVPFAWVAHMEMDFTLCQTKTGGLCFGSPCPVRSSTPGQKDDPLLRRPDRVLPLRLSKEGSQHRTIQSFDHGHQSLKHLLSTSVGGTDSPRPRGVPCYSFPKATRVCSPCGLDSKSCSTAFPLTDLPYSASRSRLPG